MTPNPSVDRTLRVGPLVRGAVNRATSATAEAGGKGINIARALTTEGIATLAVAPLSAASATVMAALLDGAAPLDAVAVAGEMRVNVSLVEEDGTVTKINEPGPELSAGETEALLARTATAAAGVAWVAASGSLPRGVPADFYAQLARRAGPGARVAVDADGAALAACRGQRLALIKPNLHELESLLERRLPTLGDVAAGAAELVREGIAAVLVSLGPDGAVLVDVDGAAHAEAPIDDVLNTVGAGDALLAGYLAAGGRREGLASAVAWSVAACRSPGTAMRRLAPTDVAAVIVHPALQADRRLAG